MATTSYNYTIDSSKSRPQHLVRRYCVRPTAKGTAALLSGQNEVGTAQSPKLEGGAQAFPIRRQT
jgi:hypothetical protein